MPLSPPITIPPGTRDVTVSNDGIVSVSIAGQEGVTQIGQIQLATFQNSAGLDPQGQNVFKESDGLGYAHSGHAGCQWWRACCQQG